MLDAKLEIPSSNNNNIPYRFNIYDLSIDYSTENTQGVYVFTKRVEVSDSYFQHQLIEIGHSKNFSSISMEEFNNAKAKGANTLCTMMCNQDEILYIIEDVKREFNRYSENEI